MTLHTLLKDFDTKTPVERIVEKRSMSYDEAKDMAHRVRLTKIGTGPYADHEARYAALVDGRFIGNVHPTFGTGRNADRRTGWELRTSETYPEHAPAAGRPYVRRSPNLTHVKSEAILSAAAQGWF